MEFRLSFFLLSFYVPFSLQFPSSLAIVFLFTAFFPVVCSPAEYLSCASSSALLLSSRVGYSGYRSGFVSLVFFYRISAFAIYKLLIWDYRLSFSVFFPLNFSLDIPYLFSQRFTVFSLLPAACPYIRLSFLFGL